MKVYFLKGMIHRSFLLLGGITIFLSSLGAVNAQTKTNLPKDTSFLGLLWFPYNRLYNKIVDVRTEMKEEVKATEERLNKRMDKAEVEIKDTLNNISQTLVKIETRLNTEERIIQIINNQNK